MEKDRLQKLFTYRYNDAFSYSIIFMDTRDGRLYLINYACDGGADGDGLYETVQELDCQSFTAIVKGKNKRINELFDGFNKDNWRDFIGVTYRELQPYARGYFVAQAGKEITRIAVSIQAAPGFKAVYITCPTEKYAVWKMAHNGIFDCLCDYESLIHGAREFKSKEYSPFKNRKFQLTLESPDPDTGTIDAAISLNRSTNIYELESIASASANEFIDTVAKECKRAPNLAK